MELRVALAFYIARKQKQKAPSRIVCESDSYWGQHEEVLLELRPKVVVGCIKIISPKSYEGKEGVNILGA